MDSQNVSKNKKLKQTKSNACLENVKSNFIFKKIFEYMKKK